MNVECTLLMVVSWYNVWHMFKELKGEIHHGGLTPLSQTYSV